MGTIQGEQTISAGVWRRQWVGRIGLAVIDQGLLAGSNFLLGVLLARWLNEREYGAYAIAFAVLLLVAGLYQSLLLVPSTILAPTTYRENEAGYLQVMIRMWMVSSVAASGSLLVLVAVLLFLPGQTELAKAFLGAALAAPPLLLLWLGRNAWYLKIAPGPAATGALLYLLLLTTGLLATVWWGLASPLTGFLVVALSSGTLGGYLLLSRMGELAEPARTISLTELWIKSWEFGKWELAISVTMWLPSNAGYLLLAGFGSTEGAGELRALQNLALPAGHAFGAILRLAQPHMSAVLSRSRSHESLARIWQLVGAALGGSLLYLLVVSAWREPLIRMIYDGKFGQVTAYVPWVILATVFWAGAEAVGVGLRGIKGSSVIFRSYFIASIVFCAVGVPLTARYGLAGVVTALVATYAVALLFQTGYLWRKGWSAGAESLRPRNGDRLRVLLSVYACRPNEGSESGLGWAHVREISRRHDVWALTRSRNRATIEAWSERNPLPNVNFVYYDPPTGISFLQRGVGEFLFYLLWQVGAYFRARGLAAEVAFDIVHHVTFSTYWLPSLLALLPSPFIWGSVGGGDSTPASLRRHYSARGRRMDLLRNCIRSVAALNPLLRLTARRSVVGIASTETTAKRMRALGCRETMVLMNTVIPNDDIWHLESGAVSSAGGEFRVVTISRLLHWKGVGLALRAFARYCDTHEEGEYSIIGEGPEMDNLLKMSKALGIEERVRFLGQMPRPQVIANLQQCDVLFNPSLHDSGGWAYLEAMSAAKPVVCLDLAGPGHIVSENSGIKVRSGSEEEVIADLSAALAKLAGDRNLCRHLGQHGLRRVKEHFSWNSRLEVLDALYRRLATSGDRLQISAAEVDSVGSL